MQKVVPFILTGSVVYVYNVARYYLPSLPDLSPIASYSFGLITLIVAFMMGNQCMEKLNHPEYTINAGLASVCTLFMSVMPTDENVDSVSALMSNLGASGIAVGMIIGLMVSIIFHIWGRLRFLKDSSIPDFLVSWINTILPFVICLALGMVLFQALAVDLFQVVLGMLQPVTSYAQTLPGFILICFIPAFFYTLGVSSWLWDAVTMPIFLAGIQANIDAVAAGQPALNIVTYEATFTMAFVTIGGMCATLGLNLLMCVSKSKQLKTMGRVFLIPSIFNINEPVMFGAPVVFNPILMLPAWINAIIGPVYVWVLMSTGLLNIPSKLIHVGQIPAPFSSMLVTEDFRAVIWWIIYLAINVMVWYPFFKVYEKSKLADEQAA
ncbi:PTS transporter subunit EIIC [Laedolimicola ammoniilytica]|uniref:PTS transporter subunit EIIC n=1 Tax=Laedolimicola ammoniilytica TaxID=2981771 RepID=A0ABT2RYA6_9FIRM|nr:PTS transporter subunit EIIC [Laedolimicola ammoniilytica]MCU6697152.1 PTS transporter subunit EIIC [Laedolimicola ammoniilytica]